MFGYFKRIFVDRFKENTLFALLLKAIKLQNVCCKPLNNLKFLF